MCLCKPAPILASKWIFQSDNMKHDNTAWSFSLTPHARSHVRACVWQLLEGGRWKGGEGWNGNCFFNMRRAPCTLTERLQGNELPMFFYISALAFRGRRLSRLRQHRHNSSRTKWERRSWQRQHLWGCCKAPASPTFPFLPTKPPPWSRRP